jgi:hypothetical protein
MTPNGAPVVFVIATRKFHFTVYGAHLGDDKGAITGSIVIYNGDVNYA